MRCKETLEILLKKFKREHTIAIVEGKPEILTNL